MKAVRFLLKRTPIDCIYHPPLHGMHALLEEIMNIGFMPRGKGKHSIVARRRSLSQGINGGCKRSNTKKGIRHGGNPQVRLTNRKECSNLGW